jgi:hypothetical protein
VRLAAALALAVAACAPALRAPAPAPAAGQPSGRSADDLLRAARTEWGRRPDPEALRRAEALFLAAADADPTAAEPLFGAIQVRIRRIDLEPDAGARAALAASAVDAGQWCEARAPGNALCDYALALALGVQARERHATAARGLPRMVERLRRAARKDPSIDQAGPERVLALVLVRAPAWPLGPGDPEGALDPARAAAARFPDHPPNRLALAEALAATGEAAAAAAEAGRALALARARVEAGDPDAAGWVREGELLLEEK